MLGGSVSISIEIASATIVGYTSIGTRHVRGIMWVRLLK